MKILLYEYITGGGLWREHPGAVPEGSLLCEGRAMAGAVADDFQALPGVQVLALRDRRLSGLELPGCEVHEVAGPAEERAALSELAALADATLLIAPELDGALLARCREVERAGGRLMGPDSAFVELAADKHATAERLLAAGLPAPQGRLLSAGTPLPRDFSYPAVLKPRRGAGSQAVRRIDSPRVPFPGGSHPEEPFPAADYRLERWIPGLAASVALLCGPACCLALPACLQRLTDDGTYRYLGGELPLRPSLDARARRLAEAAVRALGKPRGYVGVDLVLGEADDGSGDAVIEVNPRLTTSYVGLRQAARGNLAEAMLQAAGGRSPSLSFHRRRVRFTMDAGEPPGKRCETP